MPQFSPPKCCLPACFCVGLALAGGIFAQAPVRLGQEAPLLKEPGGITLATLTAGSRVVPGKTSGDFKEVTVRGWIFTASTRNDSREGFDLSTVSTENLRAEPDGAVLARVVPGALFARITRRGGWTQVRRTGWVEQRLLRPAAFPATVAREPAAKPDTGRRDTARANPPPAAAPRSGPPGDSARRVRLRAGATLSRAPDGIDVGTLVQPAPATVEAQQGDWVKVLVEAWVKRNEVEGPLSPPPAITAAMLRENPERYVGQTVDWRVQFLAHQQADELRPEMPPGRPYLLARGPMPETGFVYVLLTREQAEQLQGLQPLDELALTVTVRAARTRYLATPVVELVRVRTAK